MQIIAGLVAPHSGSISVAPGVGSSVTSASSQNQISSRVGLVFQFPERHFLGMTVRDVRLRPYDDLSPGRKSIVLSTVWCPCFQS